MCVCVCVCLNESEANRQTMFSTMWNLQTKCRLNPSLEKWTEGKRLTHGTKRRKGRQLQILD